MEKIDTERVNQNLQKIVKILVLIIGVIAIFFLARIMMIGDEAIESPPRAVERAFLGGIVHGSQRPVL